MLNSCLNFNESKPVYAYVIKKSVIQMSLNTLMVTALSIIYLNEVFRIAPQNNFQTRSIFQK